METTTILQNIGLSKKEARIYISLLKLGEANLRSISEFSEIPRTSLYIPIKALGDKGIVEHYKKGRRTFYTAIKPEKLAKLQKNRLEDFEGSLERFQKLNAEERARAKTMLFEGREGIHNILSEILDEKRPLLAVTSIEDMKKIADDYFQDFIEKRIRQHLPVKLLTNTSPDSRTLKEADPEELRETRFLPHKYNFDTANYIFGNKVAILSLKQEPIVGLLIEDSAIAETHRMYFDLIWNSLNNKTPHP